MKVVVIGACGPAGVNVCRALAFAGHDVIGLDENPLHLPFGRPYCVETILAPPVGTDRFERLLDDLAPDAVHAQPSPALRWLAERADLYPVCLPSLEVLDRCLDKRAALERWQRVHLRSGVQTIEEPYPDWLHVAAERFGLPFWLRAASGSGARGAALVTELAEGYHWLRYWQLRGVDWTWIAEEYLPGRDFCWTSLWAHGKLVASFARERLEWIYPHLAPSGRTGTPVAAVTVHEPRVNIAAEVALAAIDHEPHGIYCVDLREDRAGRPRPTEINAGRWATTSPLYALSGLNLPSLHVHAAAGVALPSCGQDVYPSGQYLLRHIDCGSAIYPAADLPELLAAAA